MFLWSLSWALYESEPQDAGSKSEAGIDRARQDASVATGRFLHMMQSIQDRVALQGSEAIVNYLPASEMALTQASECSL